ncbi:hypothetical protein HOLleu_23778 [Holothuria leucospilota]|uniref:Fibrinogen C-terminal domain-containing protein n=1 Tax=Holothuria leucospilota TaxID=206669 RepID=A0A9Q1BVI1_HOLLE|nr:hypothetical protein HOLleu_23778 [Holothuria leucospilota]
MSLTMADFVEVKIGGNANDRSEIRSCSMGQCVLQREVTTQQHLTSEEFQEFWIEHIPRESLSVSRNNQDIPIMQWTGLPVLEFKYAAFSTDDYKSGEFRFCSQNGLDFQEIQSSASAPCPKVVNHLSCTCELPTLAAEANVCHCLDHSTDVTCLWLPNDCNQLWQNGVVENGIYTIYPTRNKDLPFHVYCNMTANEGWTVRGFK